MADADWIGVGAENPIRLRGEASDGKRSGSVDEFELVLVSLSTASAVEKRFVCLLGNEFLADNGGGVKDDTRTFVLSFKIMAEIRAKVRSQLEAAIPKVEDSLIV